MVFNLRSSFIGLRYPGDHGEVAPVDGYEIRAVLFEGVGDQGVREASAVVPFIDIDQSRTLLGI
jgi:hypothetical protein